MDDPGDGRDRDSRGSWGFDAVAARLVLTVTAVLACLARAQSDTWWHLRAGRQILATSRLPTPDTWSWTAAGSPWPDHEWLWQVLAFGLDDLGGLPLLSLVNGAVATAAVALAWRTVVGRPRGAWLLLVVCVPVVAAGWSLRPQVVSLLLLALLLHLLARDRVWWLPVLFLLWAQLHGGVAAGGFVLVAAAVAAAIVRWRAPGAESRARLVRLLLVTPLCALTTLATPLGVGLWGYVLGAARGPSTAGRQALVGEWRSALTLTPVTCAYWLVLAGLALLVVLAARRGRSRSGSGGPGGRGGPGGWPGGWPVTVCLAACVPLAALGAGAERLVPFFALGALPTAVGLLPERAASPGVFPTGRAALLGVGLLGVVAVGAAYVASPEALGWRPMAPSAVAAVRTCPGQTYNTYDAGGPLLWLAPERRVFVDSRLDPYPLAVVRDAARAETTGDPSHVISRYRPRCAVVPTGSALGRGFAHAGWRTAYADQGWTVLRAPG